MTYMINYKNNQTPYEDWLKDKKPALFQTHWYSLGECSHTIFIPDSNGTSGLFYYQLNGEDANSHLYASVLIDAERKMLYIYECHFSYTDLAVYNFGKRLAKDIKNGRMSDLKDYSFDAIGNYEYNLKKFFPNDWGVSYDYTLRRHKQCIKTYRKKINRLERATQKPLPTDLKTLIHSKCVLWTDDQMHERLSDDTKAFLNQMFKTHGGGIQATSWGVVYPWGKIIALYGFDA